ncbi:MAG: 6,7-dimethyl-8-ribityllumazine synthase [Candidatus Actinomarina sp.]|tara:strand:- start:538 stop:930 length:393 start_codon:yes stop_codon:yes gene_type:complete
MNKVAVVYSSYYTDVIQGLLEGIKNTIDESFNVDYYNVPGSWDIIYKTNTLSKEYKIFIAVGVICKGDTDHYEYISNSVANGLLNLTINKGLYIANCILNVHNLEQANIRSTQELNKGSEAANAINLLFT